MSSEQKTENAEGKLAENVAPDDVNLAVSTMPVAENLPENATPTPPQLPGPLDAKQCPHCGRWALKDAACSYIFACGLADDGQFYPGAGCGRPWCWLCGKKYCGQHRDPQTGAIIDPRTSHDDQCCQGSPDYVYEEYCQGPGHAHCSRQPRQAN